MTTTKKTRGLEGVGRTSELNKQLMKKLRELRQDKSMTMRQAGIILGVPHSLVGKVETQERGMEVMEFIHYVRTIGGDPIRLLKEAVKLYDENPPQQ